MPVQPQKRGRTSLWLPFTVLAIGIGFVLGGGTVYLYLHPGARDRSPDGTEQASGLDKVVALGRIEPTDGVLSLGVATPDRIAKIKVNEGDLVKKDDELVVLDSEAMRALDKKMVGIQRDEARKRRDAIKASGDAQIHVEQTRRDQLEQVEPLEIEAQESKITFLEAQEQNALKDKERYDRAGDTISDQDKEKQKLLLKQIQTELAAARSLHKKMVKGRKLNRGLAEAQLDAARAEQKRGLSAISLETLDKQVEQADQRLKDARIRAPSDGKILRILAHEGELVAGQPILQMANTNRMMILAEVYETDINRVAVGQKASISSHIFKDAEKLTGTVVWKGSSIGKARVADLDPRAAVDNRVVEVKIELDQSERVADLIGHQVRVEIATGGGS